VVIVTLEGSLLTIYESLTTFYHWKSPDSALTVTGSSNIPNPENVVLGTCVAVVTNEPEITNHECNSFYNLVSSHADDKLCSASRTRACVGLFGGVPVPAI